MSEPWYEVEWGKVKPLQVVRETEKMVFYIDFWKKECRMLKHRSLFRTEAEANAYLLSRLQNAVVSAKKTLLEAEEELAAWKKRGEADRG